MIMNLTLVVYYIDFTGDCKYSDVRSGAGTSNRPVPTIHIYICITDKKRQEA